MKKMFERFSSWMDAVTFAEAGEFETARQMMPASPKKENRLSWLDRTFMAVTFAEAGEFETARQMMPTPQRTKNELSWFDKTFMAVTFAEADLHQEALSIMNVKQYENNGPVDFLETIGLKGINLKYAVLPIEAIS